MKREGEGENKIERGERGWGSINGGGGGGGGDTETKRIVNVRERGRE